MRDAVGYRLGVDPAEVDSVRLAALARDAAAALDDDADARGHAGPRGAGAGGRAARAGRGRGRPAGRGPPRGGRRSRDRPRGPGAGVQPHRRARRGAAGAGGRARRARRRRGAARRPAAQRGRRARARGGARALRAPTGRTCASGSAPTPASGSRRAHRDLLALDRPVRSGVRYDASSLRGRDRDVARLRALLTDARVVSIIGPGRPRQDAAGPRPRARRRAAGGARRRARRRHRGRGRRRRGRLRARRARLGQRAADADARAARRRPRPHRAAARRRAPSLLVLDNCEHVVDAVAELVAFLVSATADLRVLTTSRAPLEIGAEHVYLLGELEPADARRAVLRPRARRAPGRRAARGRSCASIVTRLDGLPLAIELAAAKVRAMAVEEIDRRLEDRFALLRGGDRSAPDRHQTLLAVIDWSWNLLDERRAARAAPARAVQRRVHARGRGRGARRRRAGRGPGARRPVAAERPRRGGRRPLPDARDRARVRPAAARARPARTARRARPGGPGRPRTPAATATACSAATSSRRSTRSPPRRSTSPTSCATRSPTATAARSSSCSPRSGSSGRSAASTPA